MTTAADDGMIRVRDARLHNLRHVDVDVSRGKLVAFTGVSGSGKSSLAFGTIHGQAQSRYLESVAPFARRLIASAVDPQVGSIAGLPPSVALEQSTSGGSARSTVGTVSTMSNTVRLLFSRVGTYPEGMGILYSDSFSPNTPEGMCPSCQGTGIVHVPTEESMVKDPSLTINEGAITAWPGAWAGKNFHDILESLGYPMDTPWRDIPQKDRDWILFTDEEPVVTIYPIRGADQVQRTYEGTWRSVASYLTKTLAQTQSDTLRARTLSFMESHPCETCGGKRLRPEALTVTYAGRHIDEFNALPLSELTPLVQGQPEGNEAERILLGSLVPILTSCLDLGLGHLTLDRQTTTLSAGELQRLRLAAQLRSGLFGVLYVLDEPSAGLHATERQALVPLLRRLIRAGNSVIVVEHDMDIVSQSDWIVDVGPLAGEGGGRVLYSGPTQDYQVDSPTHEALIHRELAPVEKPAEASGTLPLKGLHGHNLQGIDLDLGLGQFTAIAGVSGSGKSTLLAEIAHAASEDEDVDKLVEITQKPIGRTPRSCLATYTGLFDRVRKLFAGTEEAKKRKWNVSHFSFNVPKGQCPTCKGEGKIEVELVFLPGSYTTCPDCHGGRFNEETLEVTWNGYSVADVLALTVNEATEVFAEDKTVMKALTALQAVGLGYLRLGQGAPELSGGEAQRIKLATHLQKTPRGTTIYLLDEPTTGLHPADSTLLIRELRRIVSRGDTVVMAEHDLAAIAATDRVVEMGPGAGSDGGTIIADATPAELARMDTATGRCLSRRCDVGRSGR
ncbi:excinuclease ABC subunit UvrA [Corynebacterium pyruviciproducens]|uniref:UvrABC system protein A n=1 Tax=Corynebacterium pyruviciproducens TaxID=598660 RepID=A0AAF0YQ92_9CORY|nr:excinuclease ABC subunit UvrA [Corynebacterium pyruviciproducens]MDK6565501.1 excinuclease ABC subunit UvrA [Corynebacterium pyruviciproducens]WOT01405.1 excinuclease ABC subunit UvrA [Corynebacterium pyruviciproducens]